MKLVIDVDWVWAQKAALMAVDYAQGTYAHERRSSRRRALIKIAKGPDGMDTMFDIWGPAENPHVTQRRD